MAELYCIHRNSCCVRHAVEYCTPYFPRFTRFKFGLAIYTVVTVLSNSTAAHIYLTLLTHTPAHSLFPSNSLAFSISMLSQCTAPPQPLNTIPNSLTVGIAALIASADRKEFGARITTLL